jgi:hypothetical protein
VHSSIENLLEVRVGRSEDVAISSRNVRENRLRALEDALRHRERVRLRVRDARGSVDTVDVSLISVSGGFVRVDKGFGEIDAYAIGRILAVTRL